MIYIQDIITQAKYRADQENSTLCSESELLSYANHAYSSLYDLLIDSFDDFYAVTSGDLVADTDGGLILPDDFYKFVTFLNCGRVRKVSLKEYIARNIISVAYVNNSIYAIASNKVYTNSGSNKIVYVPRAKIIESLFDEIDGVNGWEEYLILSIAIKMMRKEESDTRELQLELQEMKQRIAQKAMDRDISMGGIVADVRQSESYDSLSYRGY